MLAGQDLGGSHDRRLVAGFDRDHACGQGHHGLARSHVTLEQKVHGMGLTHRVPDRVQRSALAVGQLERQRSDEPPHQLIIRRVGNAPLLTSQAPLAERDAELQREQLVELQPLASPRQLLLRIGEVKRAQGPVQGRKPFLLEQLGGQRVRDGVHELESPEHELPDGLAGNPLCCSVQRCDALRVDGVTALGQHLHVGGGHLEDAGVQADLARGGDLVADPVGSLLPRLVEEQQIQIAGPVEDADRDELSAVPHQPRAHLANAAHHCREVPAAGLPNGGDPRPVQVVTRVVVQQVAHRGDPQRIRQHRVRGRTLVLEPGAAVGDLGIDRQDRGIEVERAHSRPIRKSSRGCPPWCTSTSIPEAASRSAASTRSDSRSEGSAPTITVRIS